MHKDKKVTVLIPAAGKAERMKSDINKQYIEILGIPVLARTLQVFDENLYIDDIIIIVNENDIDYCRKEIVNKYNFSKIKNIISGGSQRQDSCKKGIDAINGDVDYVLIHDGARPFVTDDIIKNALMSIENYGVCCVCVPTKDTIKVADSDLNISNTPERKYLYSAQTPQGFKYGILKEIYERAQSDGYTATDDSQIAEYYGYVSHIVEGSYENIKITTNEDLYIAENIINERNKG